MGRSEKDKAVISGMPRGTANAHLRKKILFELLRMMGRNVCFRCSEQIDLAEDLAIEHLHDWKDNHELFWMLGNVAFSHLNCGSGAARRERNGIMLVEVRVEDTKGNQLPTCVHEGQLYIAGDKGERYNIHIKNLTSERVEVVATVDGRDVVSGEPGSLEKTGYALGPYASFHIRGFRQSNEKVAAFRFAEKSGSYSAKMGTPENVGVIGVAVFREQPHPLLLWNTEHHHHHHHYDYHDYWPCNPYIPVPGPPWPSRPGVYWNSTLGSTVHTQGLRSSDISGWEGAMGSSGPAAATNGGETTFSCNMMDDSSVPDMCREISDSGKGAEGALRGTRRRQRSAGKTAGKVEAATLKDLGTEYGESLSDRVFSTTFNRLSSTPDQMVTIYYNSMKALQKKGVPISVGCTVVAASGPNPFPNTPYVAPGFAKAPPR